MKKLLGVVLIVAGLLIMIFGYGQYGNIVCHCPAQIEGKPSTCNCGQAEEMIGHAIIYVGISVVIIGTALFLIQTFKKSNR